MNINKEIKERDLGIYLASAFIISSVFNLVGNNQIKNSLSEKTDSMTGKILILIGLIVLIIIYLVLINHDYDNYINAEEYGHDPNDEVVKLIADVIVLIGFLLVLYYFFLTAFKDDDLIVT